MEYFLYFEKGPFKTYEFVSMHMGLSWEILKSG